VYKLPTAPPSSPFQIRAAPACTGTVRNLATQALDELRNYFASGTATPSWTITPHSAKSGTWYELDPGDPTVVPALLYCGRVTGTSLDELAQHGFGGKLVPELNYAPSLGIYLVRPNRPAIPSGSPSPAP
jgi:hypothetical protein